MQVRRTPRSGSGSLSASACLAVVILAGGLAVTACGNGTGNAATKPTAQQCGMSRTAADVPVTVQVNSRQVSCSTVLTIEKDYAQAIDQGKAPGAGGAGPVPIDGWTCQAFPTPELLKTGDASKCTKGKVEILATLSTPS